MIGEPEEVASQGYVIPKSDVVAEPEHEVGMRRPEGVVEDPDLRRLSAWYRVVEEHPDAEHSESEIEEALRTSSRNGTSLESRGARSALASGMTARLVMTMSPASASFIPATSLISPDPAPRAGSKESGAGCAYGRGSR